MPALQNARHERFAQEIARGQSAAKAYVAAGYKPNDGNCIRLKGDERVAARIEEIKERQEAERTNARIAERDPETGQFVVGHNGYGGRPKGSRNRLAEQFISDLHDEWQRSGTKALARVVEDDPVAFVKVVAGVLPKEIDTTLNVRAELFADISDFAEAYRLAAQIIGAEPEPILIEAENAD